MRQILRHLTAIVGLCLFSAFAFAGPESGGGGNVCLLPSGEHRALDVAHIQKAKYEVLLNRMPSMRFAPNAVFNAYKFDHVKPFESFLRQGLLNILYKIKTHAGVKEYDLVTNALSDLTIFIVPRLPARGALGGDFSLARQVCNRSNTTAAILYDWQMGLVIDRQVWNQLSTFNQVALLIHEALRNIQIRFGYRFSEASLQSLTAAVMNGDFIQLKSELALVTRDRKFSHTRYSRDLCSEFGFKISGILGISRALREVCENPTPSRILNFYRSYQREIWERSMPATLWHEYRITDLQYGMYRTKILWAYATATGVRHNIGTNEVADYDYDFANHFVEEVRIAKDSSVAGFVPPEPWHHPATEFATRFREVWTRVRAQGH